MGFARETGMESNCARCNPTVASSMTRPLQAVAHWLASSPPGAEKSERTSAPAALPCWAPTEVAKVLGQNLLLVSPQGGTRNDGAFEKNPVVDGHGIMR